jgi:predicted ATPase/DNA-binding SARP family transcriptional activator
MRFRMLGELAVADGDVDVPIRGTRQRALLLLLLVRARETVQAERLADELWGEAPPAGWANALQALVSKLRRALGAGSAALVTGPGGYRLDVADDQIDARSFESAAERGRAALVAGDAGPAAVLLAEALALWRGRALDGNDDEGVLRREAIRLEELRWAVLEDRCEADLRCGRSAELVAELEHLVAEAPLRERLHGSLMLALYRSGRQAEALRAFQTARDLLGEELGLDPGLELRALESAILAQDPSLDLAPVAVPPPAAPRRRTNVTAPLSSFVGRAADLDALGRLVASSRLVTVVGPGGAGKTRLAHEIGMRRQADEDVWMVELAALGDPAAITDAVILALGVADRSIVGGANLADDGAASAFDRVADHIDGRPTVLLLDNCEHVVSEAARVAEGLLRACPSLRIIATSREALAVGGETLWPIPPLSRSDATALFLDRAAAVGGLDSEPGDGDVTAIDELCRRLDGLPLAIELAAARTRALPVQQLAARLDDRFRLLTGGARTALPRQQTLRAVVEWSHDLLFSDEQLVFARLAVFAGGCTLEAAEAVCAGGPIDAMDVADILSHLVDKSLVIGDRSGGRARFRLLQTLALYGRERLAALDEADEVRTRHADHYGEICERGPAAFEGRGQAAWLAEAAAEADNIRTALAWRIEQGDAESALAIAGGLGWSFWLGGGGDEGVRLLDAALACPGEASVARRAHAMMWSSAVRANSGSGLDEAVALGERARELWRDVGDDRGRRDATTLLAGVHVMRGDRERAIELFDEATALYEVDDDDWSQAVATSAAGRAASIRGDLVAAEAFQHRCVAHFEAAGVLWAMAAVNSDIALIAEMRGDLDAAVTATEKALGAARAIGLSLPEAQLLARLGNLMLELGDSARAEALHTEALAVGEDRGAKLGVTFALVGRATMRRRAGRFDEAAALATEALTLYRAADAPIGVARALSVLGFVAEQQGRLDEARQFHQDALDLTHDRDPRLAAQALEGLAGVEAAEGDGRLAARLLGRAGQLRRESGGAPAGYPSDVERISEATMALLGEAAFSDAYQAGSSVPTEDLVGPGRVGA